MESRSASRGAGISKWLIGLFALIIAVALGAEAGYVVASISAAFGATEEGPAFADPLDEFTP